MSESYITTRYSYVPKRKVVWEEVCKYLNRHFIPTESRVLELGCGYGDFIGNIIAGCKAAIEIDRFFESYLSKYDKIDTFWGDGASILADMNENSYDIVFASNYFEHFALKDIEQQLSLIREITSSNGKLIVIQPNFQLCTRNYYDDWTHKTAFSHVSFADLLAVNGYMIDQCYPKFLPFSFKSNIPINRLLVRLYLYSPYKPRAAQFLVVSCVNK